MLTATTCVTVACDSCGDQYRDEELDTTVHFATESEAVAWLTDRGWHVTNDGRTLSCDRCIARQLCAVHGHELHVWHDCLCEPGRSDHSTDHNGRCLRQFAWCDRCEHHESRRRDSDVAAAS